MKFCIISSGNSHFKNIHRYIAIFKIRNYITYSLNK